MADYPEFALSVRQPWADAIIHGGKDIENRSWQAVNHGLKRRGRICIHASASMTRREYESARRFIEECGAYCPRPHKLRFGRIIGSVEVIDVVTESDSPWWMGPRGLVLANPQPIHDNRLVVGQLGYFKWKFEDISGPEAKPWMVSWPEPHKGRKPRSNTKDMFNDQ